MFSCQCGPLPVVLLHNLFTSSFYFLLTVSAKTYFSTKYFISSSSQRASIYGELLPEKVWFPSACGGGSGFKAPEQTSVLMTEIKAALSLCDSEMWLGAADAVIIRTLFCSLHLQLPLGPDQWLVNPFPERTHRSRLPRADRPLISWNGVPLRPFLGSPVSCLRRGPARGTEKRVCVWKIHSPSLWQSVILESVRYEVQPILQRGFRVLLTAAGAILTFSHLKSPSLLDSSNWSRITKMCQTSPNKVTWGQISDCRRHFASVFWPS